MTIRWLKVTFKGLIFLIFFASFYVKSVSPPDILFRVDLRPPEDSNPLAQDGAFTRGLTPWATGNAANLNVADHVSGRSCTARNAVRNSGFLSTTTDRGFAQDYIRSLLHALAPEQGVTLYTIRATSIFYESYETLRYVHDTGLENISANEFILAMAESEWLTAGPIPNNLIIRAEVFNTDGSVNTIENPNYVPIEESDVRASSGPYRAYQPSPLRSNWRSWVNDTIIPLISSCFHSQPQPSDVRIFSISKPHSHEFSSYIMIPLIK